MNMFRGIVFSLLAHAVLLFVCLGFVQLQKANLTGFMEIDLGSDSLILKPADAVRAKKSAAADIWYIQLKGIAGVVIKPVTNTAAAIDTTSVCPPPCPLVSSDWKAASLASRKPQWLEGMITENDYPPEARKRGEEGMVKVQVLIDTKGEVRDVVIISAKNESFSVLVKEKLMNSRFSPALDAEGNPINVRMMMPVVFRLK